MKKILLPGMLVLPALFLSAAHPTFAQPTPAATPTPKPADSSAQLRQATLAYNAGLTALKKNDWALASADFEKAVALSPTDAGSLSFLGYVRIQQKRWDDALTALQSAQDNGKNLDVRARAQLLNNIGFARWNKDQYPAARTAFEEALKLDPAYNDARYNLAFAMLSRNDYDAAIPHLRLLIAANGKDAALQDGMAEALEKTGKTGTALGFYKKAIDLDPKNENYRFKFAVALLNSSRRADAIEQLRGVLAVNPNNTAALLQLGDLHLRSNHYSDAAAALKRYVVLRGSDFTGRFNLGVALDYSSKFDDALVQYGEAEKLRPNDAGVQNNIGRIYYKRQKYDEATEKFNRALLIDPNFHDARVNLAITLADEGKYAESNAQWQQLLENAAAQSRAATTASVKQDLNARILTAQSGLGSNFLAQQKWTEAAAQYRRLLQTQPNDIDARMGLGRALYNLKDYDGAEKVLREVVELSPKNASAYNDLGVVLEAKKDRKGALDSYEQALAIQPDHAEAKSNVARLKAKAVVS